MVVNYRLVQWAAAARQSAPVTVPPLLDSITLAVVISTLLSSPSSLKPKVSSFRARPGAGVDFLGQDKIY
jgi:hypothetical protein